MVIRGLAASVAVNENHSIQNAAGRWKKCFLKRMHRDLAVTGFAQVFEYRVLAERPVAA